MKNISYHSYHIISAIFFLLISCIACQEPVQKKQSDFFFKIPDVGINVITSKRSGAEFYVMFSKNDSIVHLSDSIDYLHFETSSNSSMEIIFDPKNKNDIYVRESSYMKAMNAAKFNFHVLNSNEYDSLFFEPRIRTQPLILKYPFIQLGIGTSGYAIYIKKYDISLIRVKEGDIYGGW